MSVSLSKRLQVVADSAPVCETLVDVGCDHGQVSVYIAQNRIAKKIIASDIRPGPLSKAREAIKKENLEDMITPVLTDGLSGIAPCDTVIIAGMGGETVAEILGKAEWTKAGCTLILQPMSKAERLRVFLYENGYFIEKEQFVKDSGHVYSVMTVVGGETGRYEAWEAYLSKNAASSEALLEYLEETVSRLETELSRKLAAGDIGGDETLKRKEALQGLRDRRDGLWQK